MAKIFCDLLAWDSDFFGFKVCRLRGTIENKDDLEQALGLLDRQEVKLAYYQAKRRLMDACDDFGLFAIKLVDRKTTYVKAIDEGIEPHVSVQSYAKEYPDSHMLDLAVESGEYSRFRVDEKIGRENFQKLYRQWVVNSVRREISDEVFVYIEKKEVVGLVTLGKKNDRADIGIIAVSSGHRGKGIGKALMRSAEKWFFDRDYEVVQVVAQGDNTPACRFYERCGYSIESVDFFYHIWRE